MPTIKNLYPTFTVKFDFKPTRFQGGWTNVLHMTSNGQNGGYGGRVPGVWFHGSSAGATRNRFHICAAVNTVGNFCYNSAVNSIPRGQWTSVSIAQRPEGAFYRYEVKINGKVLGSTLNKKARTWPNVKVYGADNWYNAAQGIMRNLVISTKAKAPSVAGKNFLLLRNFSPENKILVPFGNLNLFLALLGNQKNESLYASAQYFVDIHVAIFPRIPK